MQAIPLFMSRLSPNSFLIQQNEGCLGHFSIMKVLRGFFGLHVDISYLNWLSLFWVWGYSKLMAYLKVINLEPLTQISTCPTSSVRSGNEKKKKVQNSQVVEVDIESFTEGNPNVMCNTIHARISFFRQNKNSQLDPKDHPWFFEKIR